MATNKTQPTSDSVDSFLNQITPDSKKQDCLVLTQIMEEISGCPPVMWGSMVGFGKYDYRYASGREGSFFKIGFAPRSKNISVYACAYDDAVDAKKAELGKVKLGKGCIYIQKLSDIDLDKLKEVLYDSIEIIDRRYPNA